MTAALVPVAPDVKMWLPCSRGGAQLQAELLRARKQLGPCDPPGAPAEHRRGSGWSASASLVGPSHREDHGVGEHLNQLLVHEPHVPRPKEPYFTWPVILDG